MVEEKVFFEYGDGSYLEAVIRDGKLVKCPIIKISPPEEWGGGAFTLDGAIEFLKNIKSAIKRTTVTEETFEKHRELVLDSDRVIGFK